jgi:hypothetical protein
MKTATDARRWTQIKPVFLGPWNNCFSQSRIPPGSSGEFSVAVQSSVACRRVAKCPEMKRDTRVEHPFLIHKLILYSSVFICVYLWRHSSRRSAKPEMKTATDARRWTQIKPVFLGPWNNCFSQSRMPPGSSGEFSVAVQAFHGHACVEARSRMRPLRVTELGRLPHGGVSHRGLSGQCVPVGIGVGHLVGAGEDDARSTQMAFAACLGGCYARERF